MLLRSMVRRPRTTVVCLAVVPVVWVAVIELGLVFRLISYLNGM